MFCSLLFMWLFWYHLYLSIASSLRRIPFIFFIILKLFLHGLFKGYLPLRYRLI